MTVKITKKRIALGLGSIIIIVLLLSKIELKELVDTILAIDPMAYLLAFAIYTSGYFVRILRLRYVLGKSSFKTWFQFMGVFQLLNRTLPFRSGEIFFPILLKRLIGIGHAEAISKLIIVRFLDLITLFLFFLISLLWVQVDNFGLMIGVSVLIFLLFILLYFKRTPLIKFAVRMVVKLKPSLESKLTELSDTIIAAFAVSRKQMVVLTFYSLLDKVINYAALVVVVLGMGFSIGVEKLSVAIGLSGFSEILPINSLGSFGTLELGWVGALTMFGVDENTSIQSGFSTHIVAFSYTIILGLVSALLYLANKRK